MNKTFQTLTLVLCFFALAQTTQAQSKAELKAQVMKAQEAEKLALIQAKNATEAQINALQAKEQAEKAHKEALLSKMQVEKVLTEARLALEVANAEKAILEKKVAELTKKKK